MLKEKNNSYEALQNTIHDFKKSHCQNNVFIETYEEMKELMKEKRRKFLDLAQISYTSCQDISKEINTGQVKCKTNEELLNKNQEKLKLKQEKFENENKKIDQQLEAIANSLEETESLKNNESYASMLLKTELDDFEKEIKEYENSQNRKDIFLNEQEKEEEKECQKIIEEFFIVDNQTIKYTEQLEENRKRMYQEITEVKNVLKGIEDE